MCVQLALNDSETSLFALASGHCRVSGLWTFSILGFVSTPTADLAHPIFLLEKDKNILLCSLHVSSCHHMVCTGFGHLQASL
jgi:hypothetical protein